MIVIALFLARGIIIIIRSFNVISINIMVSISLINCVLLEGCMRELLHYARTTRRGPTSAEQKQSRCSATIPAHNSIERT